MKLKVLAERCAAPFVLCVAQGSHSPLTVRLFNVQRRGASHIAFSDSTSTKVFKVAIADNRTRKTTVSKVHGLALASVFSHALAFTPDGVCVCGRACM